MIIEVFSAGPNYHYVHNTNDPKHHVSQIYTGGGTALELWLSGPKLTKQYAKKMCLWGLRVLIFGESDRIKDFDVIGC